MAERKTVQKELIAAALKELGTHPTADQVYEYIHSSQPSVSRATVFRVLRQMSENGQAGRIGIWNGADCFDWNVTPHCHARCICCHKIFDICSVKPPLELIYPEQADGFQITGYSLLYEGLCRDCREKKEEH